MMKKTIASLAFLVAIPWSALAGSATDLYFRIYVEPFVRGSEDRVAQELVSPALYDRFAPADEETLPERRVHSYRAGPVTLVANAPASPFEWHEEPRRQMFRVYLQ